MERLASAAYINVGVGDGVSLRTITSALRRGSEDFGAGNLTAAPLELQHLHADPCLQEPRVSEQLNRGASS